MRFPSLTARWFWLAVFTSVIISILFAFLFSSRSYDDPYITYRYADNLRRGFEFVYNPGERIQSTTTPFFTLLLAALSILWGDIPRLANWIGVLSLAAGGLLLWGLAAAWKTPWAGWAGLLLYPLFPLAIAPLGSETPLYIAFCLGAFTAYARGHYRVTAACAALAVLTRPDGLLVAVVLAADFTIQYFRQHRSRPIPWAAMILYLGLLLPWFIFAWVYFGSPLPATLAAKQQQGDMIVSQRFAQGFLIVLSRYTSWRYVLEAALAFLGVVYSFRVSRRWLLFLAWPVLYFAAFSILGVSSYFWYYSPLVPGFIMLAGLGLQAVPSWRRLLPAGWEMPVTGVHFHLPAPWNKLLPALKSQALCLALLAILCLAQASGLPRLRQPDARYAIYRAAGNWLAAHTPSQAVVGALEVGILGYYARRPMVDFAGLLRPQVAAQLSVGASYEHAAWWVVEHYHPQYLVLFPGEFPTLDQAYVAQNCRQVKLFSGPNFGVHRDLAVYNCR
jgi:hypothetical protein